MAPHGGPPPDGDTGGRLWTICLLGETGSGKSSTGNTLLGRRGDGVFVVGNSSTSVTAKTTAQVGAWRGRGADVRCVDSPGLHDSEGRDACHAEAMAEYLKSQVGHVHAFLLLFNSSDPRMSIHTKEMLNKLRLTFGDAFLHHLVIGFTRWEYDKRAKRRRSREGETEEQKAATINLNLRELLRHSFDCPCIFLDNNLNKATDEELVDDFGDELVSVLDDFEGQLQKLCDFMCQKSSEPFFCDAVEAEAAKDELRTRVGATLQSCHLLDEEKLGRRLIIAEQDVIHRGWLYCGRSWKHAVLKRQQLRFYAHDSCNTPRGETLELSGSICSPVYHRFTRYPRFIIYRPVVPGDSQSYYFLELRTMSDEDRKKWVLFVQEATQFSESWFRIQRFHEQLDQAQSRCKYRDAMDKIEKKTMVIPVEWVLQKSKTPHLGKARLPSLIQQDKDLKREKVTVDGRLLVHPTAKELVSEVAWRILQGLPRRQDEERRQDDEMKAILLARDVVLTCSRTLAGGDTFEAVQMFFGNERLVMCIPVQTEEPVSVTILAAQNAPQPALKAIGSSTGLPEFEHDGSSVNLGMERVRCMNLQKEQHLQVNAVDKEHWVQDWDAMQCMRCGVPFHTWLRRHHCRACGVVVCFSCSRHFVPVANNRHAQGPDAGAGPPRGEVRVCFQCFQKEVYRDLKERKEDPAEDGELLIASDLARELQREGSDPGTPTMMADDAAEEESAISTPEGSFAPPVGDDEVTWPLISIEMTSRFKICDANPDNERDATWFMLECRYVRVVRWSGLADEGRVFISLSSDRSKVGVTP